MEAAAPIDSRWPPKECLYSAPTRDGQTEREREKEAKRKMRSFLVPSLLALAVNVHCNVVSLLAFYKCDLAYSAATRKVHAESRRDRGRAVWVDAGRPRGGRADRNRRIRARKAAAGKEGGASSGRARPLNSEGNIFWGVVVVVRRPFHGTTERRVTLFSILSFFFSLLPVSVSLRSGWGNTVSRQFHSGPACEARSKADQSPKCLSRGRGGRIA